MHAMTKTKFVAGDMAPPITAPSIHGKQIRIPEPTARVVHLQFRRFAGCPICNLHLRNLTSHADELRMAGIHEVVVFHSSQDELRHYHAELPFDCIADPGKTLYRRYGVESSLKSLLHPAALWASVRGVVTGRYIPLKIENGPLGLPADFLIAPDGRILAAHYGRHADDNWDFGTLIALVNAVTRNENRQ